MSDPVVSGPSAIPTHPAERKQFWRDAIAAFHSSGLSVREFCRRHGLHEKRFYTWRKHLGLSPVARPTPTTSAAATPPVPGFVPVRLVADATTEVTLPGGVVVRVPVSSDPAHVARLVAPCGVPGTGPDHPSGGRLLTGDGAGGWNDPQPVPVRQENRRAVP